jgi:phosphonate transport system substrate-binding protein
VARGAIGFGIVRSIDPTRGRARLAELCEALGKDLDSLFIPHHPESYRKLVSAFEAGDVAVAWLPPIASAQLVERGRAELLALPIRRGAVAYRSALIVRRGGPASLADLKGRRMAWVDPESSSGYLVPRLMLHGAGFDVTSFFSEERFLMSHSGVVDAVASGRYDVGATYCAVEGGSGVHGSWTGATEVPLEVLATSGSIPNDAIVVSTTLPSDVRSQLLRWLISMRSPSAKRLCADLFSADSFRVASTAHFEPLRRIVLAARARGTIPPPR